jgi:squalene-hopene/tetraprenyl-beta-curcumene cyclase
MLDLARLRAAYERARDELLAERTPDGHWVGELSSSALSTATAVSALAVVKAATSGRGLGVQGSGTQRVPGVQEEERLDELIHRGVEWLVRQQNEDGGFGDTDLSRSNIATTMLVAAALKLAGVADEHAELMERANRYIDAKGRLPGLRERYGVDRSFVVPIMMNLALAGVVDWRDVDPLPFELACVPQSGYRFVGMPVVSYAIPALVAIGQARYFHAPPRNPITRLLRRLSIDRSLRVLRRMQPDSGGYLEATPLTSFVVMSLASIHRSPHAPREESITRSVMPTVREVIREGVKFLFNSVHPDGSWPIDTNLATWNTTLAINALAAAGEDVASLLDPKCLDWLLSCQHLKRHPFTGANPGGFGWSDLSGAVPDADDTPGAMLAVEALLEDGKQDEDSLKDAIERHIVAYLWLLGLQNRDGGWPTFCRGWGKLPFDRSGSDLTAHALRALAIVRNAAVMLAALHKRQPSRFLPLERGLAFLKSQQHADGSWSPLWFGNQDHPKEENPVYGTAKVLMAYRDLGLMESPEAKRGVAWLVANQNEDGGWGSGVWTKVWNAECGMRNSGQTKRTTQHGVESLGESVLSTKYSVLSTATNLNNEIQNQNPQIPNLKSSIEETALAVEALLAALPLNPGYPLGARTLNPLSAAIDRGLAWLIDRVEAGQHRQPAPIGFYFAKLWYYEKLYPLIFAVVALGRACRQFARTEPSPHLPAEPASSDA